MAYAYLDKYDILHVVDDKEVAELAAKGGNYVTTTIANANGYPTAGGKPVFLYAAEKKAFIGGNKNSGKKYDYTENNELMGLLKQLQ